MPEATGLFAWQQFTVCNAAKVAKLRFPKWRDGRIEWDQQETFRYSWLTPNYFDERE
jgi:hypothetical protein